MCRWQISIFGESLFFLKAQRLSSISAGWRGMDFCKELTLTPRHFSRMYKQKTLPWETDEEEAIVLLSSSQGTLCFQETRDNRCSILM